MKARSVRLAILSVGALAALSACKKAPESNDIGTTLSGKDVEGAANALKLDPGEWELKVETTDMQAPALPPEAVQGNIGKIQSFTMCVTEDEGANPGKLFLKGMDEAKCTATKMTVVNGKVDAVITCPVPDQPSAHMRTTLTGTYMPDRYDLDMDTIIEGLPNDASITMKAKNTGQRMGACPADDLAPKNVIE